jgi:Acetyltransferase (GNAT) domain
MPAEPGRMSEDDRRFEVRSYRPGDEAAILELFARSFHLPRSLEHWRWKFQQNPFGVERISLAFDRDHRLVAQYAGYPVPFRVGGQDVIGMQIGDTMTDPGVRHVGRGPSSLLGRVAAHFYQTHCEGQVAFNFGFNVSNIQKFSLRFLRSERVESVPYRRRDLLRNPMPSPSRVARLMRGFRIEMVQRMTDEFDDLFRRASVACDFLVRRDRQYLQWRYLQRPDVQYMVLAVRKWGRLVGWSAFRLQDERLVWGDALFDPAVPEAVDVLIRQIGPQFAERGVWMIEGWFPSRSALLARRLDELELVSAPEPDDLSLMCVPFTMSDAAERMRSAFFYTKGDGDLF